MENRDLIDVSMFFNEPAKIYHGQAGNYLSSHQLIDFMRSPLLYYTKLLAPTKTSCDAFVVGEATHCCALEGSEEFERRFRNDSEAPRNPKTGEIYGATSKTYREWAATQNKAVLTEAQERLVYEMVRSVRSHRVAQGLLRVGRSEQVFRGEYCGVDCQIRVDWLNPYGIIVDYKTCDTLEFFERDAKRYGYFIQAAFYRALTRVATGETFDFKIIATEKREPYATAVYDLACLDAVEAQTVAAIERLLECWENNVFPTGYEDERVLVCSM